MRVAEEGCRAVELYRSCAPVALCCRRERYHNHGQLRTEVTSVSCARCVTLDRWSCQVLVTTDRRSCGLFREGIPFPAVIL